MTISSKTYFLPYSWKNDVTWKEEQQRSRNCLFIVKFETIPLIKEMRSSHYEELQLTEDVPKKTNVALFSLHDFLRALSTWSTLVHNFIFCSVTHDLFHPAEKDLKCYTAKAEMKEHRNDSLPPHSTPTFPKLDRNVFLLPCSTSFSSSKNPVENASILTTAWPGWQLI